MRFTPRLISVLTTSLILVPGLGAQTLPSSAETWILANLKGYSASADSGYKFGPDGVSNPMVLIFDGDSGSVTGSDLKFFRLGKSTLVGLAVNDKGMETIEVYQIDRINKKVLYGKSRIGTKTTSKIFSDLIISCIGNAKRAPD